MITIVQLADGCYKVTIDFSVGGFSVHKEYTFALTESNAEPKADGEKMQFELKLM